MNFFQLLGNIGQALLQVLPHAKHPQGFIGRVQSLWQKPSSRVGETRVEVFPCEIGGINGHYGMMELRRGEESTWIRAKVDFFRFKIPLHSALIWV